MGMIKTFRSVVQFDSITLDFRTGLFYAVSIIFGNCFGMAPKWVSI